MAISDQMESRLQKILAHAGIASRRKAEEMIQQGRVALNGKVVQDMGVRADPDRDVISVDGRKIPPSRLPVYILVNKPRNVVSTLSDPEKRRTVVDLLGGRVRERVYPVGRLDFASEGLLILTNDGEFTRFMTRGGRVPKVYRVKVSPPPSEKELDRLRRGIRMEGVRSAPCDIRPFKTRANPWYEVTLHQGRNRQIRKMFYAIGHHVLKLHRVRIGFLDAPKLKVGDWRPLTPLEVKKFYDKYADKTTTERTTVARRATRARADKHDRQDRNRRAT